MQPDPWHLYRQMLRSRLVEESAASLWRQGVISGEMHLGTGEEGIVAGVVSHLMDGDAMALDHRGTAPLLMRGVSPVKLLREFLGQRDGLCGGLGGHMHLFSPEDLAASSGIVGASGPAAVGFALAAQHLRPGSVAVSFFGEGAMNQGMMLESLNLAVAWRLPVLFVCKDNHWAITTESPSVTGGQLVDRARGFGMSTAEAVGWQVENVWSAARDGVDRARRGDGPTFVHARCVHLEGHFLGDQLIRISRHPFSEMAEMSGPLLRSALKRKGTTLRDRTRSAGTILQLIGKTFREQSSKQEDPVAVLRDALQSDRNRLEEVETHVAREVQTAVQTALEAPRSEKREP